MHLLSFIIPKQRFTHCPLQRKTGGGSYVPSLFFKNAGIAQLAERLICNQQVVGSIPTISSMRERPAIVQEGPVRIDWFVEEYKHLERTFDYELHIR